MLRPKTNPAKDLPIQPRPTGSEPRRIKRGRRCTKAPDGIAACHVNMHMSTVDKQFCQVSHQYDQIARIFIVLCGCGIWPLQDGEGIVT